MLHLLSLPKIPQQLWVEGMNRISGMARQRMIDYLAYHHIHGTAKQVEQPKPHTKANNKCDTNADTCCLGTNFIILNYSQQMANVHAYDKSIAPTTDIPVVSGVTTYDDPISGDTYMLIFHEALHDGSKLDHSFINPSQIHANGIDF